MSDEKKKPFAPHEKDACNKMIRDMDLFMAGTDDEGRLLAVCVTAACAIAANFPETRASMMPLISRMGPGADDMFAMFSLDPKSAIDTLCVAVATAAVTSMRGKPTKRDGIADATGPLTILHNGSAAAVLVSGSSPQDAMRRGPDAVGNRCITTQEVQAIYAWARAVGFPLGDPSVSVGIAGQVSQNN